MLTGAGDSEARRRLREHVAHRATVASVRDLLNGGGFSVIRVVEKTGRLRFANGTALLNHYFIKLGFLDAWKKVVAGHEIEMFLRLRRRLDEVASQQGELALTIPMAYVEAVAV